MYAAHNPDVKAAVAWYGAPARRPFAAGRQDALDVARQIKAPVLGLYGGADAGIPNDTVEKMFAALKAAGNAKSEITLYPDTPHAFHADYRPSYRKQQAEDGVEQDAGVVEAKPVKTSLKRRPPASTLLMASMIRRSRSTPSPSARNASL